MTARIEEAQSLAEAFCSGSGRRSVIVWEPSAPNERVAVMASDAFPPLSLSKLLVVEAAIDALDLEQTIADDMLPETIYRNVLAAMRPRTSTVRELIALTITTSDNVAAEWLWRRLGPDVIADACARIGLRETVITAGFSDAELGSDLHRSRTTAADVSRVVQHLWSRRERDPGHRLIWRALLNGVRNSRIPGLLPHEVPVAHKTGSLDTLSHDAGIVLSSRPFGIVVLTDIEGDAYDVDRSIAGLVCSVTEILSPGDLDESA